MFYASTYHDGTIIFNEGALAGFDADKYTPLGSEHTKSIRYTGEIRGKYREEIKMRISHKCFRGGKVHKTFLLGFCIFAFVLFRVFWYRTFYIINEVEFTVWKHVRDAI